MSHKTMIDGVAYEISGGKTLVNGTAYKIDKGKTLVGGTAYTISFFPAVGTALSACTPEEIQAIAQSGLASSYWSVGDKIGIALSGTVGYLSLSGTYYAFIIGFNHNSSREGSGTIHFQFGKTSGGVDIAFIDSNYWDINKTGGFTMNTSKSNSGGWASCYMRSTICPAFLSTMPTAWQNVIKACTKFSDNTGGGSDTANYVTATSDKIWLLSEFEVSGVRKYANSAEQNYQKQYDYYKNGNSTVKYRHTDTANTAFYWLRSVREYNGTEFCSDFGGEISHNYAYWSHAFAPGFMVA